MNRSRLRTWGIPAVASALLLVASCASISQTLRIAPLPGDYPVSASSSLLVGGQTIPESDLRFVKDFHFTKYFSPKMTRRDMQLDLAEDLKEILDQADANAIIRLKISVANIDTSNVSWVMVERYTGSLMLGTGVAIWGFYGTYGSSPDVTNAVGAAVGVTIVGAALLAGSWLHESLGTIGYSVDIDGTAVTY
jgi:hypothetical protein